MTTGQTGNTADTDTQRPTSVTSPTLRQAHHRDRWLIAVGALVMWVMVWAAYIPALRAGYVWDDDTFLWNNPHIVAHASPAHFWKLWGADRPPDYFPLTSTMLWMEWHWLWGESPTGYHAVNVALHACGALLLWAVLRKLGMGLGWAWIGAMLYALHPVNVESVAWITERKNTLPWPLLLGALWCWLESEERRGRSQRGAGAWLGAALVLFVLSLLAKTAGVLLPVVMAAIVWWRHGRWTWRDGVRALPFVIASITLGIITVWYQSAFAIGDDLVRDDSMVSRVLTAARAVWFYGWKTLWPSGLSFVYPKWTAAQPWRVTSWLPLLGLIAVAGVLWKYRGRAWARLGAMAGVIYLAMLLPVLGLVNIYFMRYAWVSDHWQYFAVAVPVALFAVACEVLARRGVRTGLACAAVAMGVILIFCVRVPIEAAKYHSLETLWRATMKTTPGAWLPYNNLGGNYLLIGRPRDAISLLERAIMIDPTQSESHNNLGSAFEATEDPSGAERSYLRALAISPGSTAVLSNLGRLYLQNGRLDAALRRMNEALSRMPQSSRAHFNVGLVLMNMGRYDEAEATYRRAIELDPTNDVAHNNLGATLVKLNRLEEALAAFRETLRINPAHVEAVGNITAVEEALEKRRAQQP